MIRFPRPGEAVKFQDGPDVREGICNGEPKALTVEPWVLSHLPVHLPEVNENMMIHVKNIIEWPEDEPLTAIYPAATALAKVADRVRHA